MNESKTPRTDAFAAENRMLKQCNGQLNAMVDTLQSSRDKWRKVAEMLTEGIGCGCGIDGPCQHCSELLAAFNALKEEEK